MNLKQQTIQWINSWQTADYKAAIALAFALGVPQHTIRSVMSTDTENNRKILLTRFGECLKKGIPESLTVPGVSTAAVDSQRPATVPPIKSVDISGINHQLPEKVVTNTDGLKAISPGELPEIPEIVLLKNEKDAMVGLLVANHIRLKSATTDKERQAIMTEQTQIQKSRAEIDKNIRLVQKGMPVEEAATVKEADEEIFTIPDTPVEIQAKKRKHTRARTKAAADMRKYKDDPDKLASATNRWNKYDQAFKILDNALKENS